MYILLGIIAVIIVAVAFILFTKCKLSVEYSVPGGAKIRIGILGMWFEINNRQKKTAKKPEKDETEEKKTLDDIKESYEKILISIFEIKRKLNIEKADFKIDFGLWDAAATGIALGAAWAVIGSLKALLKSQFVIKEYSADVRPYFLGEKLEASFLVIFSMKIIDMLIILKKINKIK